MKYFFIAVLWSFAACDGAATMPLIISANASPTCGGQDQPCCVPSGGGASTCTAPLMCDGIAYASVSVVTTDGVCGTYGGLHQPCGPSGYCFEPHQCMTTDGSGTSRECLDTDGGGLTCGNSGQPCCSEIPSPPGSMGSPPQWCHLGLRCTAGGCSP